MCTTIKMKTRKVTNSKKYTCKQQTQMLTQNYEHVWMYINGYNVRIVPFTKKVIYVTNLDVGGCEETLCFPVLMQPWKKMLSKMLWWCWIYVLISSWQWLEIASYKVYQYSISNTSIHLLKQNCKHIFWCPLLANFKSTSCQFEHSHILSSSCPRSTWGCCKSTQ